MTNVEAQAEGYAAAKLKWFDNKKPLPFVYEATGTLTRFTDLRDPKPRSREVFSFARPETLAEWLAATQIPPRPPARHPRSRPHRPTRLPNHRHPKPRNFL